MTSIFSMCKVSARWYSCLLGTAAIAFSIPNIASAQTSLTWAKVETVRNRVHLIPSGRQARRARVTDVMRIGDALRTASSARAELRFNDGSLARVGEQATFRFTPNTRNFQLSNGTVLLLIPPGHGRTTIQTPNAVTGIQGSALFVRVRCLAELSAEGYCASPSTIVGALTNNPAGAMVAFNSSGSQQQSIYAGDMVVIEGDEIVESLEFDLRTFYETSGLVEGLDLDSKTPPASLSKDLQEVWQEIQDALELQGDFDDHGSSEEIVVNPSFIAPTRDNAEQNPIEPGFVATVFDNFPEFSSSAAATFHSPETQLATASASRNYVPGNSIERGASNINEANLAEPINSARVAERLGNSGSSSTGAISLGEPTATVITPRETAPAPVQATTLSSNIGNQQVTIPNDTPSNVAPPVSTPAVPEITIPAVDNTPPVANVPEVATPAVDNTPPVANVPEVTTPAVDNTPPVANVPEVATPAVDNTPPVANVPEQSPVNNSPEADQVPERSPASPSDFNLNTPGATTPPDVLETPDLSLTGGG